MGRLIGAVAVVALACWAAPPAASPTPGDPCPSVRASATAGDGAELVCDEQGRWVRRYAP